MKTSQQNSATKLPRASRTGDTLVPPLQSFSQALTGSYAPEINCSNQFMIDRYIMSESSKGPVFSWYIYLLENSSQ